MSYYFFLRDSPLVGLGLLIHEVCFLHHTRHTTVGRTPLDEWLGRHRDLHLATHNTHNRQTSMPPVGFEPTISASERPKTYALDRAATGTDITDEIMISDNLELMSFVTEKNEGVPRKLWSSQNLQSWRSQLLCIEVLRNYGFVHETL